MAFVFGLLALGFSYTVAYIVGGKPVMEPFVVGTSLGLGLAVILNVISEWERKT